MQICGIKTPCTYSFSSFPCHQSGTNWLFFSSVPWKPYIKAPASYLPMWKLRRGRSDSQLTASWQTFLAVLWLSSLCSLELLARHSSPLFPYHLDTYTGNSEHSFWSCQSQQESPITERSSWFPLSWLWQTYPDNVPFDQMKENLTNSHIHFTFRSGA